MALCAPCTRLKDIALCTDSIIIGTVGSINTSYNIYFRSLANGMVVRYTATSDGLGLLILTPINGFALSSHTGYEIFVNKTNANLTGENLTIGSTIATCFNLSFIHVVYEFTSQTLEIE